MGKSFKYPIFLPNLGIVLDKPGEFLNNQVSPYSRNMEFYNEEIMGRGGLSKMSSTALNGAVLRQATMKLFSGTNYSIFATATDIYAYDFGNSRFDILTPTYTTGTITILARSPTVVTGSGTSWASNLGAGDFIKIGSSAIHTGSTWYEIASVDSDTQVTLTAAAATCSGSAYVARTIFSGSDTDIWDYAEFLDDNLGQVIVFTNGVDAPHYWAGSGQMVKMTTLPTSFTTARYVSVYKSRLIFLWCVMAGGNEPTLEYWSGVADLTSWDDTHFKYFNDEDIEELRGSVVFSGYHIVFKETKAFVGRYIDETTIFDYESTSICKGVRAPFSIVKKNDFIMYYAPDKKFHAYNLLADNVISESLFPETKEFDPNYDEYIIGRELQRRNQVRWFCPYGDTTKNNYVFVFDYAKNIPFVWAYQEDDACMSMGSYIRTSDVYADDAIYGEQYADETSGYADDSEFLSNAEILIYGGYDGYIRIADSGTTDDGTAFTRQLKFKILNFDKPTTRKRLESQQWWLKADVSGSVTIKLSLDTKTTYESGSQTISLVPDNSDTDVIKKFITWNKHAQTFQPEISATNDFSLLGFINNYFDKGEVIK